MVIPWRRWFQQCLRWWWWTTTGQCAPTTIISHCPPGKLPRDRITPRPHLRAPVPSVSIHDSSVDRPVPGTPALCATYDLFSVALVSVQRGEAQNWKCSRRATGARLLSKVTSVPRKGRQTRPINNPPSPSLFFAYAIYTKTVCLSVSRKLLFLMSH